MCDEKHYDELREEHDELDDRVSELEKGLVKTEVKIENIDLRLNQIASGVSVLVKCVYGLLAVSFIVLLCTVVYGAIGEKGLHSVIQESKAVEAK